MLAVLVGLLYYLALCHGLGQHDTLLVVLQSGEYLIGIAVEQAHKGHPFLLVVLEAHHVALQFLRPHLHHFRMFARTHRFALRLLRLLLFVLVRHGNHHSRAASVAIDGASLAARTPRFHIELVHEVFVDVVRQVHGDAYRVVNPLLYGALHAHLHEPVHIVGRGFVVGRACHKCVNLLLGVPLGCVNAVHLHPREELAVIDDVLLKRVAHLIHEVHMSVFVARIYLPPTLIHRHEHRLYAACGLRHKACRTRRGYCQTGNVAPSILLHVGIQAGVGLFYTSDERIVLLPLGIVYLESAALTGHVHRRTVGRQSQSLVHFHREVGGFLRSVVQVHGGYHVALAGYAHACAASHAALALYLFPKVLFGSLHLAALRVALHLIYYKVNLFQLQVHNVVHQPLGSLHVLAEQLEVETGRTGKRIFHV